MTPSAAMSVNRRVTEWLRCRSTLRAVGFCGATVARSTVPYRFRSCPTESDARDDLKVVIGVSQTDDVSPTTSTWTDIGLAWIDG